MRTTAGARSRGPGSRTRWEAGREAGARTRGSRGEAPVRGRTARALAAAVAALAAAGLVAGCGGGGSSGGTAGHRTPPPVSATVSSTADSEPPVSSAPGVGPDGTAETVPPTAVGGRAQATVPRARLTPATGTFTERQKDYLVGKVPEGMDPAAVLQNGQDACDRIADTVQEDAGAARRAVADGEIPGARDAIRYLCPKFQYLLG